MGQIAMIKYYFSEFNKKIMGKYFKIPFWINKYKQLRVRLIFNMDKPKFRNYFLIFKCLLIIVVARLTYGNGSNYLQCGVS